MTTANIEYAKRLDVCPQEVAFEEGMIPNVVLLRCIYRNKISGKRERFDFFQKLIDYKYAVYGLDFFNEDAVRGRIRLVINNTFAKPLI